MLTVGLGINIGSGITLSTGTLGGSIQFAQTGGTNQYVKTASGSSADALSLGTGNFTVECWLYFSTTIALNENKAVLFKRAGGQYEYGLSLGYNTNITPNQYITWYQASTSSTVQITAAQPNLNQWHHIAIVRNSSTITMYIDGTSVGTFNNPSDLVNNTGAPLNLAYNGYDPVPLYFNGSLNNIRIVPGVAVYTSDFTPATDNLTAIQNANVNGSPSAAISSGQTKLLLNTPRGANFLQDTSGSNFTFTQGGTSNATSSTNAPF